MLDDEVLMLLCDVSGHPEKKAEVAEAKKTAIAAAVANGHHPDDIKKASGRICEACRRILQLRDAGSTSRAFIRDTLAPLVTPNTEIYKQLKEIIFKSAAASGAAGS